MILLPHRAGRKASPEEDIRDISRVLLWSCHHIRGSVLAGCTGFENQCLRICAFSPELRKAGHLGDVSADQKALGNRVASEPGHRQPSRPHSPVPGLKRPPQHFCVAHFRTGP